MGILFLLTDSQIVDERFLVYINDMLATGTVSDLFTTVRDRPFYPPFQGHSFSFPFGWYV